MNSRAAYEASSPTSGPHCAGRFFQHYSHGSGDYTQDRHKVLPQYETTEELLADIKRWHEETREERRLRDERHEARRANHVQLSEPNPTGEQIRLAGIEAITREIGPDGLARFIERISSPPPGRGTIKPFTP